MADNVSRHSKSGKTMNKIEFIIFGAIILYIIVIVINYMKSVPIKGYEIQMGSLSVSKAYTGVALRKEKLIQSPYTGYINFYVREGERVSSRDNVYSIDESGKLASMLNSGELGENIYSDEDLSEFRTEIIQYDRVYDDKQFNSVYDFKYELEGDVVKLINSNMYENMEELTASNLSGMISMCTTGESGYVVYNIDGYEELTPEQISVDIFEQSAYEKKRINNNELVEANSTIGKLITSEEWSIVIPIDEEKAVELEEESYVEVKFIKTQESSWAKVLIHRLEDGVYAELVFNNSCVTFCADRFVDIELNIDDEEGLKVPNSAIAEKEFFIVPAEYMSKEGANGSYGVFKETFDENGSVVRTFVETTVYSSDENEFYIDNRDLSVGDYICKPESEDKMAVSKSGTLIGVYNMNKGYADFKQITILAQNDEYAIVSSNTKYGLTVYDRIVLDASSVNDDEFIYK